MTRYKVIRDLDGKKDLCFKSETSQQASSPGTYWQQAQQTLLRSG